MKLKPLLLGLGCVAFAGCESLSDARDSVREKFAGRDGSRTRTVATVPRAAYEAVKGVANQMGYRFVRGGAAQGELEAVSGLAQGETNRSSRQVAMKVRLHATLDGAGTEVSVRFTEIIEADSANRAGMATVSPLRDTPQYEVFFRELEQAVAAQASPK